MVRRTKEDSQETRLAIIAAARETFHQYGVTRTTMEQIATAAGVTRGAIYWHFADKTALFYAMREQVTLPLMDHTNLELLGGKTRDPLQRIEQFLNALVGALTNCENVRQIFEIMNFKCEYVDELCPELVECKTVHSELLTKFTSIYREAQRMNLLRPGLSADTAAAGTLIFSSGLIRLWLMDESSTLVRTRVPQLIAAHIDNHRAVISKI